MNFKSFTSSCICLLLFFQLQAQPPGRGGGKRPGGGRGPQIELAPGTGAFFGMIIDEQNEEPILLANVLIYAQGSDELLTGTTTNERGFFVVKDLEYGTYDLEFSYLGYENQRKESLNLSEETPRNRVGRIQLAASANVLDEVEITAERAAVEFGLDRRVFNVSQDVASSGGTAEDLLKNIPSIIVDLDGNISLRGSANVRILINGKPSALTGMGRQAFLQQISAASIERVEVLTNPSAKYNPEGMAGIINIITKQQNKQGFNLITSINIGTNDKYNGNLDMNYRVGKFNLQAGYSYNDDDRFFRGERYRTTMTSDTSWVLDQDIFGDRNRKSHTVRTGLEYFVNRKGTITAQASYSDQSGVDYSNRDNRFLDVLDNPLYFSFREEIGSEIGEAWEYTIDYRQRFRKDGQELTITGRRSTDEEVEMENFTETQSNILGEFVSEDRQENPQMDGNHQWLFQADFTNPLSETLKMEAGLRASLRGVDIDNQLFNFDPVTNSLLLVDSLSNVFGYDEDIYSAYTTLSGSMKSWEWQVGLRAEQTNTTSTLLSPQKSSVENNYFNVFPSAFLTYNLNESTALQASYSRRINRPRYRALNPFVDYGDPLNPRGGNPYLTPEFVNSYEITWLKTTNKGSLTFSGYLREMTDIISRLSKADPTTGVNVRSFANLNSGRNYGLEVIATFRPTDKWNLMVSGNGYRSEIDGSNFEADLNAEGYQFSGRLQSTWTVLKDLNVQLTGFYRSPGVRPQGEMKSMYSFDLGLRKSILKKKGTLTFRVTDLFNARKWRYTTENNGFLVSATLKRESRIAYLGFTYSLKQDKSRRRNQRNRGEGGGGDDDGI